MKRTIIFAGNYKQAANFAREAGWDPPMWVFAADRFRVAGLDRSQFEATKIGTWRDNPNVVEAFDYWMSPTQGKGANDG